MERDGKNLGPMRKEHRFDYNHQTEMEPVNALRTLLPGDRLAATCHFDTSSVPADSEVQIGEESNKEMCFPGKYLCLLRLYFVMLVPIANSLSPCRSLLLSQTEVNSVYLFPS